MIVQTQLFIFYCVIDEYRASQAAQQQAVCLPKAGDTGGAGSIPGSGWSPGEGKGSPLRYSGLGDPMDRGAWRATAHGVQRVGHKSVTEHMD